MPSPINGDDQPRPGDIFYDNIGIAPSAPGSPDELLEFIELDYWLYEQHGNPANALFAFDALWKLGGATAATDPPHNTPVSVPWWVVRAIGLGWLAYRRAAISAKGESLETAMGFKVYGGRGKALARFEMERRDHMLSLDVAVLELRGLTRTAATDQVATRYGMGFEAVRKIYAEHGQFARDKVKSRTAIEGK